jgi:hypothetical protein
MYLEAHPLITTSVILLDDVGLLLVVSFWRGDCVTTVLDTTSPFYHHYSRRMPCGS